MKTLEIIALVLAIIVLIPFAIASVSMVIEWITGKWG
jgi:hypothetical protein